MKTATIEVLLVEEDLSEADRICGLLTESRLPEFAVLHVMDLAQGLDLLEDRPFDVILVDLGPPETLSLEPAHAVRNQSPATPVVALAPPGYENQTLELLPGDIEDYLVKGEISGSILIRTIRHAIERKRYQEALREGEEALREAQSQLQLIADTIAVGVARCSSECRYLWVNPTHARWLKREPEQIVGSSIADILGPAGYQAIVPYVERVLSGERVEYEAKVDFQGPGPVWIHAIYLPTFGSDGQPDGWVAVVTDVTERKRVESKLQESETKFSKAFQAAPALISISSLNESRYLDVNEEFLRTLEFERDEVVGHTAWELGIWVTSADRELLARMLRDNQKVRDFETHLRKKSGARLPGLLSMEIIEIEGEECLLTITRDISDLRKAEEERTRLAMIVESSDDAIIGKTLEGTITSWNKGAERIYGYTAQEVKGKPISLLAPPHFPDEIPQILRKMRQGELIKRLETTRVRKDGTWIPVSLTISPIWDENGSIVGASTIARDVSERKGAEQEIARLNADLQARALELEGANRDLEAFNYTVAHDLRQPLTVINSYCQAIDTLCGGGLNTECRDYVQGVYDGALRMNRLIEALLDFSRLAHAELRRETVDLSALAREVADEMRLAEPGRHVELRIADGIIAFGDPNLLRVVLHNLLGNAWKYTGRRENAIVEFAARREEGSTVYLVRDNGSGFDSAHAGRIFDPFQRLPGSEEFRGFGVGLATVARIIGRHGGKVWAEGEPGRGATFYFTCGSAEPEALSSEVEKA
jgi:PAS domain S-box-containing protein